MRDEQKLDATKIKGHCLYQISGLKVNIKYDREKNEGDFWFNVSPSYISGIKGTKVDFFIFICEEPEHFFVIPNNKMEDFMKDAYIDKRDGRPHFHIQTIKDIWYFRGKGTKNEISKYYRNLKPILEYSF